MKLILGSNSPRRKEILSMYGIPFEVHGSDFEERLVSTDLDPEEYVRCISEGKGKVLADKHPQQPIITADTTVYCDKKFYNKPDDATDALRMLMELSGKFHYIYTAVTLSFEGEQTTIVVKTKAKLRNLSQLQFQTYLQTFKPLDKAGAYGIQDGYGIIMEKIDGNMTDVIGLPLEPLEELLSKIGIDAWSGFA